MAWETACLTILSTPKNLTWPLKNVVIIILPVVPSMYGTPLFRPTVLNVSRRPWNCPALGRLKARSPYPAKLRCLTPVIIWPGQASVQRTGRCTLGILSRVPTSSLANRITERMTDRGRIIILTRLGPNLKSYPVLTILNFPPTTAVELTATPPFTR